MQLKEWISYINVFCTFISVNFDGYGLQLRAFLLYCNLLRCIFTSNQSVSYQYCLLVRRNCGKLHYICLAKKWLWSTISQTTFTHFASAVIFMSSLYPLKNHLSSRALKWTKEILMQLWHPQNAAKGVILYYKLFICGSSPYFYIWDSDYIVFSWTIYFFCLSPSSHRKPSLSFYCLLLTSLIYCHFSPVTGLQRLWDGRKDSGSCKYTMSFPVSP